MSTTIISVPNSSPCLGSVSQVYDSPWALSPVIKRGDAQVFSKDADLVGTTSIYSSQSQVVVRSMTTRPVQFDVSRVSKLRY